MDNVINNENEIHPNNAKILVKALLYPYKDKNTSSIFRKRTYLEERS
jgi:hypothetical protein